MIPELEHYVKAHGIDHKLKAVLNDEHTQRELMEHVMSVLGDKFILEALYMGSEKAHHTIQETAEHLHKDLED